MSVAVDIVRAYQDGKQAAQEGRRRSTCPHDPNANDPRTRNLFRFWMRGYAEVIPSPIDYSD
ncbi:hypothetical protein FHX37_4197 [Haloactinospora alba]|uniref:Uncharacterized protein n=1 Tax=Haloactinospora alba TaxID=405555 RepID=A0A543N6Q1_9ACTN|nr:hypothetical protein FHX37_4641 [Haloactinospora alba]TQN27477.1 hypothetical protein FHX37_4197 [Haloactinospora alba]